MAFSKCTSGRKGESFSAAVRCPFSFAFRRSERRGKPSFANCFLSISKRHLKLFKAKCEKREGIVSFLHRKFNLLFAVVHPRSARQNEKQPRTNISGQNECKCKYQLHNASNWIKIYLSEWFDGRKSEKKSRQTSRQRLPLWMRWHFCVGGEVN